MYSKIAIIPAVAEAVPLDDEPDDLDELIARFSVEDPDLPRMVHALADARCMIRDLAVIRAQAGITQAQVAERLGTTQSAIARLERAEGFPNLETLVKYATVLGRRVTLA
jgi:DNA-binding XRE family transcriptional regulator